MTDTLPPNPAIEEALTPEVIDAFEVPATVAIDTTNMEVSTRTELASMFEMISMGGGPEVGLSLLLGMFPVDIPSDDAMAALVHRVLNGPPIVLTATQGGQTFTLVLR